MGAPGVADPVYIRKGVLLRDDTLMIDLGSPQTLHVQGINTLTGETKDYLLKVTVSGKLLLV